MKKLLCILLCGILSMSFVACGDSAEAKDETSAKASESEAVSDDLTAVEPEEDIDEMFTLDSDQSNGDPSVDLDLTALSATMVYSEVFNMMTAPDEFKDMKIKMAGTCSVYVDEATGKTYYACIVQDATQCCSQGLEFVLNDTYSAEDYPANGDEITIKGTFSTYTEGEMTYITMLDAEME